MPTIAPFDGAGLLRFFAARAVPGVEEVEWAAAVTGGEPVEGGTYRRSVPGGVLELRVLEDAAELRIHGDVIDAERHGRALLDLDIDPEAVRHTLGADALLRPLVEGAPGRRVPGVVDGGEIAIRAVLGQQVSVPAARTLAARLTAEYGERLRAPVKGITHLFPTPAGLAAIDPETLPMPRARGHALVTLAQALTEGLDPRDRDALTQLPGIGPWTADYVAMRCGDHDALLETDLGVKRALRALKRPEDPEWLRKRGRRWQPYRSYALMHLWSLA
jgi:AraC family transcriptional regulator, regulatory protein of adaptative response / DNA-3-methyladenine glycosylase II